LLSTLTGLLARLLVRLLVRLAGLVVALLAGIIILVHYELLGVGGTETNSKGTRSRQFAAPYDMPQHGYQTRCRPKRKAGTIYEAVAVTGLFARLSRHVPHVGHVVV
jgi:hypothetical protein